nr:retrotransposon Gag domain, retroviral aspartyl protease [Tanacetum cinerariifolium]
MAGHNDRLAKVIQFSGGADLVLGIQWLATLNTVQANWKEMFMIFNVEGKRYKLQGITTDSQRSSSFQYLAIEPGTISKIPDTLQPVVQHYNTVFEDPRSLHPTRSQNHSIPLLPNSTSPNIRLYRYPYFQKAEIQPYRQKSLAKCRYETLSPRFFGPYCVKRVIGPVPYELELPDDAKIRPVFHVSMLKPVHGSFSSDSIAWEIDVQPASVVDHRWVIEAS